MTPQAQCRARTFPLSIQEKIVELRRSGKTIAEICAALELDGNSAIASVQICCLQHFGKRDLRGPEIGHLPEKTKSFRRGMAQ